MELAARSAADRRSRLICGLQPTLTFCIAAALFLVRCVTSVTLPRR